MPLHFNPPAPDFWFGPRRLVQVPSGGLVHPNSLPRHPLNTWTFLFIVHIPTQHSHMHTRRLKTFRPQPQEPGGGRGGRAGPTGAGRGRGRLLLPSLPGARRLHKQESWRGCPQQCAGERGGNVTGRCGIGTSLPVRARGVRNHKNTFPSSHPRSKVLRLGWGGSGTEM